MSNIVAIENDGTKVRYIVQDGKNFSYSDFPKGIIRVVESNDDTITVKLNNELHTSNS